VNGREVGDEERRVWRIMSCLSTPCEMPSFIVWMMAGIAEKKTARGNERLEGDEDNGDNFGNFCCPVDEGGAERFILENHSRRKAAMTTMRCLSERQKAHASACPASK
jgi:hypothetical protein